MKILALSARLPYPLDTGAKIRSFHILKALAEKHELTLLSFVGSHEESGYVDFLKNMGINVVPVLNPEIDKGLSPLTILKSALSSLPLTVVKYASQTFRSQLDRLLARKFDLIHCEHLHMAQYIPSDLPQLMTFDAHNVESEIVLRLQAQETGLFRKMALAWHSKRTRQYEQESLKKFDLVMAVSDRDREALAALSGRQNARTVENGVDTGFFFPGKFADGRSIVFVGSMDWWPNDDGIRNFITDTLPLILAKAPDVKLHVVGRKPSRSLVAIAQESDSIVVTGTVDDVRPYIESAAVYVVPLRVGGGTRLKVLEAFSMGKAVVSTSLGSEGIEYTPGKDILIEDDPAGFADAVLRLLEDSELRTTLGANAADLAVKSYSWKTIGAKLQGYYDELERRASK